MSSTPPQPDQEPRARRPNRRVLYVALILVAIVVVIFDIVRDFVR